MSNRQVVWLSADDPPGAFPPVEQALHEPDGLLAAGGDLGVARLLEAYRRGIFPWYEEGQPLLWWSPDPRCVFRQGDFRPSRRLHREVRRSDAEIRFNTAFGEVIRACAGPRGRQFGTWITDDMVRAYERLHDEGWAHSIEIWQNGTLTGGLYGLVIGRALFGESMFSAQSNASKFALLFLDRLLDDGILGLVDCQVQSAHLVSLGASVIPRPDFVGLLDQFCDPPRAFKHWPTAPISVRELAQSAAPG